MPVPEPHARNVDREGGTPDGALRAASLDRSRWVADPQSGDELRVGLGSSRQQRRALPGPSATCRLSLDRSRPLVHAGALASWHLDAMDELPFTARYERPHGQSARLVPMELLLGLDSAVGRV